MRVCMVTTCFPRHVGDFAGNFILQPARELARHGVDVDIVAPHDAGAPLHDCFDGVHVHRFRYAWPARLQKLAYGDGIPDNLQNYPIARAEVPLLFAAMAAKTVQVARRADVIHAYWSPCAIAAAAASKLWRIPIILRILGDDVRQGHRRMNRFALSITSGIVCCEGDLLQLLEPYDYRGPLFDIKHLPDFDRLDEGGQLEPDLLQWCRQAQFVVTFLGRLIHFKDPLGFIRSLPHVMAQFSDARFLIVGDGPMRPQAEALADELSLRHCLRFTGSRQDVGPILKASTVFVANSPFTNCGSTTILEAMHLGTPVVLTNVGDPTGSYSAKDYVQLVRPSDPQDLARGICELLAQPELRRHRTAMGRVFLRDMGYDRDIVPKQLIHAYHEVRKRSQARPLRTS